MRSGFRPRFAVPSVVFALGFALAPAQLVALSAARPVRDYSLDVWTTREGLPHNLVQSIAQTPDGYLWFGTWEGLVRFNGREFRVFDRANVPEMRDEGIRVVRTVRDGSLWLGTSRGGVMHLRDGRWRQFSMADGLPSDEITDVAEDARGRIWVATESHGLAVIDTDGGINAIRAADGLPSDGLMTIEVERDAIWVGTANGVARVRGDRVDSFGAEHGLPAGSVFSVLARSNGEVWVGTEAGPYRFDGARFVPALPAAKLPDDNIPSMYEDRAGNVWLGMVNYGIVRWRGGGAERLTLEDGLPNTRVAAMFEDREGSLWIGTNGGLVRLKDAPFTTYTTQKGMSDNYVRAVLEDASGTMWFGTSRGLTFRRGNEWGVFRATDGLPSDAVLALHAARDGALWVGSYGNGVAVLRDGAWRTYGMGEGLPGSQVRALAETQDGAMWIGTSRGLARLHDGAIRGYTEDNGLPRNYILALFVDSRGTLWVGTANGLALIRGEAIEIADDPAFADIQDVFGFHEDARGAVWVATDRGVLRYRDGRYAHVSTAEGLPEDTVFQILEDGNGYFWLTSNRGIFRIARAELDAVADGVKPRVADVASYGEADGMASAQCNGGTQPAAWASRDGALWFATARGVATVRPEYLDDYDQPPPPVVIEELLVDETDRALGAETVLPAGTRKFEFRFAGLTFLFPEKVRYRYRLDGFDEKWVETQRLRSAQYTNLAPGTYRFAVTAAQENGVWNPRAATAVMRIEPYYWQTRMFRLTAIAAGLLLIWGVYRLRMAQLRERERELESLVETRTRALEEQTERLVETDREKSGLLERLREQSEAFELQAREDALTRLPNRRRFDQLFAEQFEQCRAAGLPITAALLDIDHFKRINDRYSHAAGDAVLRMIGQLIADACRGRGIASRYGGEEFAMAFPGASAAEAAAWCEELRLAVARCDYSGVHPELRVAVSVGLSGRSDAINHERLLALADAKLYEAKHSGRDRVVW